MYTEQKNFFKNFLKDVGMGFTENLLFLLSGISPCCSCTNHFFHYACTVFSKMIFLNMVAKNDFPILDFDTGCAVK